MTTASRSSGEAPDRRLYVVATVHLDTQWRWTVQDTIRDFLPATLERNFEIFERYPFFVVSFEGAFRYRLLQEYDPEGFEKLRQWVEAGRWRVAGSMLDSPDVNIVAPESLLRHILYGNRFFERELGGRSRDLFLPDCFGFGFALPSIAAHCGLLGFSAQKFGNWMAPASIPWDVGVWQGPDDCEIVAAIRPEGYGEGLDEDLSRAERFVERLDRTGSQSGAYVGIKYVGVGDRGGGLDDDSLRWLERSLAGDGPVRVILSGSDQLFQELSEAEIAALPRHRGELLLPTHGTGCLTSQARLKRWNRRNELLADAAERAATLAAWLADSPYPAARLEQAWTRFLWHQMHDDLTGTSIPAAYRFTDNDELLSLNQFASVLTESVGALATRLDCRGEGRPVVVFNPLSCERSDVVQIELEADMELPDRPRVVGPEGREVPSQTIEVGGRPAILFLARLPPLGLAVYHLELDSESEETATDLHISDGSLANGRYRVEVASDGDIEQIHDLATGRDLLSSPLRLELLPDRSARWPAWEILYEDLCEQQPPIVDGPIERRIVEHGPVRVTLETVRRCHGSTFRQQIRLVTGAAGDSVEIVHDVDWATRGRLLKAAFRFAIESPTALFDLGLGLIERGRSRREKYEVPAQQWAAVCAPTDDAGVSVLNDCKYGWDKPDDRTLRLSLLRSPRVIRKFRHQGRQDHGRHRFTIAIAGHLPDWRPARSSWQAARLNQPLQPFFTSRHTGALGKSISGLALSNDEVVLQALKRAESGDGWVARLRELSGGDPGRVSLALPRAVARAHSVNGMEDACGSAHVEGHRIVVTTGPFSLASLAFELSPSASPATGFEQRAIALPWDRGATRAQGCRDAKGFDGRGHSIPAELWPERLDYGGIEFRLGATDDDEANVLACRGQTLDLGDHEGDRLHLLAASIEGSATVAWTLGERSEQLRIPHYSGIFAGRPQRRRFGRWSGPDRRRPTWLGREDRVAWIGTHRHDSEGRDEPYVFCYLFAFTLRLVRGQRTIELPRAPEVQLFAATVADDRIADTLPAFPLYD